MDDKHFDEWMGLKSDLHQHGAIRTSNEGEIWWCAVGENVGIEINGKSELFSRPVLVLKKLGKFGFTGIPLTSQPHNGSWYVKFEFKNKTQIAIIAQPRTMSVSRLYKKIGQVPQTDLELVRQAFLRLYSKNIP